MVESSMVIHKKKSKNSDMKVRVTIDGFIDVDDDATQEQIEDAVYFQLGIGGMDADNPVGDPDWSNADVDVHI